MQLEGELLPRQAAASSLLVVGRTPAANLSR
jgi:hypothetical protein